MLKEMSARVDVQVFGWNMDENFRIGRLNDFSEWKCPFTVLGETLVMGRGNNDVALVLAPDEFYNHILLQNVIVFESSAARLENVNAFERASVEDHSPKSSVVRAIAE